MEKQERELQVTKEELQKIENAMKNEEFRKMFAEYAQEIANPENRKKYEDEIAQLEAERGVDVKFVNPQDGFVVKTLIKSEGGMKAFVNICQSEVISKATCQASRKTVNENSVKGQAWSIPYSLNQPREDTDKAGKKCKVFDVIFHTQTYQMGQEHSRFKQLIINTAFDGLEKTWNVKLDRKNLKYPKLKFKGQKTSTVIRTSNDKGVKNSGAGIQVGNTTLPYPYKDKKPNLEQRISGNSDQDDSSSMSHSSTPKYSIVHRGHLDLQNFTNARDCRVSTRPQELVVNVDLPLCETSSGVDLDIFEKKIILDCSDPNYHLDVPLPYPVKEDKGRAQFDKSKRRLTVTLPVLPAVIPNGFAESGTTDSEENGLVTEIVDDSVCGVQDGVNDVDDNRDDLNSLSSTSCDIKNEMDNSKPKSAAVFKMPPYSFHQNKESVTFVLHVSNVALETVSLGFTANKCCVNFPSTPSKASTEFVDPGYALYIEFPDECLIDAERSSVDLNETNLVLVLYKQENCVGMWQSFMVGADEHSLEKEILLTEKTLQESLDRVKDRWAREQPISVIHRIESSCEKETVIELDVKRGIYEHSEDMGNILASAEDVFSEEVKHNVNTKEDIENGVERECNGTDTKDDIVIVDYEDLDEVEVIEENCDGDEGLAQEPKRLSTVQEIDAANTEKADAATGDSEMQRARAIKCRKNRRRRRRSTGSHESSSFSEEEEGLTRRGKTRGKHARHPRKSRSLSLGSSAESHDDVDADGHPRCVRFNPVPEVRVFSNKADKRKWKELRKQQSLNGSTESDNTHAQSMDKICVKLKSSLKESRSSDKEILNISSDDGNTGQAENAAKKVISDDINNDDENQFDSIDDDPDDNQNNDDDLFTKEKPTLTNPLIFDLDD